KPVQTEELIATIKDKLSTATDKKTSTDAGTDVRILSTEEIFGDLLDGILDTDEPKEAAASEEKGPEAEPVEEETAASDETSAEEIELDDIEADDAPDDSLADLSDLEELAKETVPALVDAVEAQAREIGDPGEDLDVAELLRQTAPAPAPPEPAPAPAAVDIDEDLEAKLSDTLAGVLAASLGAASQPEKASTDDGSAADVDSLLSQALDGLDLGKAKTPAPDAPAAPPTAEADEEIPEATEETEEEVEAASDQEPPQDDLSDEIDALVSEAEAVSEEEPEPEPEPASEPVIEFGEYTLEERIGLGGMAEVWKARRKGVEGFEKRVAIKKILPQPAENQDFVDMFIDEAKLAAQLNHQNITHIYDLGKVDDDYFIAMEYVEGQNLRQLLDTGRKKDKPLPAGLALYIASRTADALDYAHRSKDFNNTELGLVHRDVSPHNVLISYEGDIKLCDFGIAKAVSKISTTQMGALKGKLQYMSPEQAWGRSIDHRSDIFSTGTVLFEMLTGERLFTGESELSVLEAVRECETAERIIQNPSIPSRVSRVKGLLLKALAKETDERYETAGELQGGLEELLAEFDPTPGQREMSSYVQELLDRPESAAQQSEPESEDLDTSVSVPVVEEADDELSEPAAILLAEAPDESAGVEDSEEDEKRKPAFLKWLSRLLPVVAVLAVGGYLIAGRSGESPEPRPSAETAAATITETRAFRPEAVEPSLSPESTVEEDRAASGTETVQAAAQPPAQEPSTTPPAPESQQPEEPVVEAEPDATEPDATEPDSAQADAEQPPLETADPQSLQATQDSTADPELERRVEEDLQRVQELISTPDFAAEDAPEEASATEPITELTETATEDSTSMDQETTGFDDGPPLTAEGGDPPESSFPTTGSEMADASPDLPIAPPADESTATQPGDLVEQGPGVVGPQVQSFQPPAYSEVARRVGATGTVRVAVLVNENGQVLEARLIEGLRQKVGLDEQTLEAARRATFRPATKDGVPVTMWHELAVQFQP
ncbi:MAG: TonB family protein, partial [Bacteroidia bacterium]|nr:TonB family protein [Bacteroidia bacterium]